MVGVLVHTFGGIVAKQRFLQAVEASEFRIGGFLLIIIFTRIDAAVEIGEQFSNRFNTLIMLTGWRIQRFRFFQIASFNRIGKGFGARNQLCGFGCHIGFVFGNRAAQTQQSIALCGIRRCTTFYDQFAFRVSQQAAGHIIFARLQVSRHFLAKAWRNVFAFFNHHNAFEDLPLQRFLAVVLDDELRFPGVYRDRHRFTLFVVNRDFHLRNIGGLCRKSGCKQRGNTQLQRTTAKIKRHNLSL